MRYLEFCYEKSTEIIFLEATRDTSIRHFHKRRAKFLPSLSTISQQ